MNRRLENVTCCGCGLLCDDILLEISPLEISTSNACSCGQRFLTALVENSSNSATANSDQDLKTARQWLKAANSPMMCGLQGLSLEMQTECIRFAQSEQMVLSTGKDSESTLAYQKYGGSGCSFGELRHRCDLLICFNFDPFSQWPRFSERFLDPKGQFITSRNDRTVYYVGTSENLGSSENFDEVFLLDDKSLLESLVQIRKNLQCDYRGTSSELQKLCQIFGEQTAKSQYPILLQGSAEFGVATQLTQMLMEINKTARLHRIVAGSGIHHGSPQETILAMTGFPDHISFRQDGSEYDPQRYHAKRLIAHNEVDCVVVVGETDLEDLLQTSTARIIRMTNSQTISSWTSDRMIELRWNQFSGTQLRCDGVPVPVKEFAEEAASIPLRSLFQLLMS
ncbi:hypothetical protein [Rubinisphaera italica]|uniref:Formyltransferase/hydrolase complex Fhc subunit B n=1 Tax=Rubinisphaera italica TaxID=2527969 RepID=A0A5C5XLM7_9PLAN|nr:hypothetical protein [Rubinisphaera italica]TWT64116.1 hypothetical protein Pan54_48770 [Rubinisphaera italica]